MKFQAEIRAQGAPADAEGSTAPGFVQVAAAARQAVAFFTELPVDAVASCNPGPDGWTAVVDVVEARARMGDNDLLAIYEVRLAAQARVEGLTRLGRYRRDDAAERRS
ncbi:MAG: gas vesicle protein GvpO [Sandaracinaceae bacterium]